jgi:serine/threonine protein kinase
LVSTPTWSLGAVIARRYRLDAELGRGGFGAVFRATVLDTREPVALKLLSSAMRDDPTSVARFRREAEVARTLVHPSTVRVLDFGDAGDGTPFIVFELLEGLTLEEALRRGPLPSDQALHVALEVLGSLEEAHAAGIVHRDLKPANVMLCARPQTGVVKLLDFGVAKRAAEHAPLTQEGMIVGTAAYMAPEQIAGHEVGPTTDLYALGVTMAEMLAGAPVFTGAPMAICVEKLRAGRVTLPEAVVRSPFGGVIERATRHAAGARYASAGAMREALLATGVVPERPGLAAAVDRAAALAPTVAMPSEPRAAPVPPKPARSRLPLIALASGAVAAAALAAGSFFGLAKPVPAGRATSPPSVSSLEPTAPAPVPRASGTIRVPPACPAAPRDLAAAERLVAEIATSEALTAVTSRDERVVFYRLELEKTDTPGDWQHAAHLKDGGDSRGVVAVIGSTSAEQRKRYVAAMPDEGHVFEGPQAIVIVHDLPAELERRVLAKLCGPR